MFIHKVFILRYAVETVIGSVRKHSLFVDINSSVSNICRLHLFVVAFCIQKTIRFRPLFFLMEKKDYKNIDNKFNSTDITRQGFDRRFGTKLVKENIDFHMHVSMQVKIASGLKFYQKRWSSTPKS